MWLEGFAFLTLPLRREGRQKGGRGGRPWPVRARVCVSVVIVFWQKLGVGKGRRESVASSPATSCQSLTVVYGRTQGVEKRKCGCLNRLRRHLRCFITTVLPLRQFFIPPIYSTNLQFDYSKLESGWHLQPLRHFVSIKRSSTYLHDEIDWVAALWLAD